ncbi:MAG TPA: TolC family protein [Chitinophagaceae bacterium]|nr:TolC family protein [Chitinophagaceae bacterium]
MRTGRIWHSIPFLLLFLVLTTSALAQKNYQLTAREAADFAVKNVTSIKNLQIDKEIQVAKNKEIRGQALPQLNGTVSGSHYFVIPTTLLPDFISPSVYGVLEKEGVQNGSGGPIVAPSGPPALLPAQFGVPWQASAGFTFQQLFFQPDVFVGLQAREVALRYAENNIKAMEDSVRINVYRAYYSVLIAEKRRTFLDDGVKRLEKLSSDQEVLFKNGFAERLDIDRTQVDLNNLRSSLVQLDNLIYIGYASLKYSLGLKQVDTLMLKDTLSTELVKKGILDTSGFKYEDRNEVQILNTVKELQGLDVKRYKLQYFPTVAGYWNFSETAQRRSFNFLDFDQPWYQTSVAGVNISVPIFDGLQRQYKVKQAKLNLAKTENSLEDLYRVIDFQREAAYNQFRNAITALDVQERNMELAQKVYNTTKRKYEQGLGSSFELLQTESSYEAAQSNYFQALYDAVVAKLTYYRSLGRLQ